MKNETETKTKMKGFASEEPGAIVYTIPGPGDKDPPKRCMVVLPKDNVSKKVVIQSTGTQEPYNPGNYADTIKDAVSKSIDGAWEAHHQRTVDLFEWIEKMKCSQVPF